MKRNIKRLPALLLAVILCLSLLPVTALAANFPTKFYASVNYDYSSYSKSVIFGTVTQSSSGDLSYEGFGEKTDRVVYGMEYAGGVFYTVEGTKLNKNADDGFRELRMYNSSLTSYRTIGEVNQKNGGYWIIDTAMDISGAEPVLYGTYNGYALIDGDVAYCSSICQISLTDGKTSNWKTVTGIPDTDIIYAMAFNKNGTLYAISADMGDDGGPASLYTINKASGAATLVEAIKTSSGSSVSTNWIQDLAFDHASGILYWMENDKKVLYTVDTTSAVATSVGSLPTLQSFCIPYDAAFAGNKHMVSVICEGAGTVTSSEDEHPFYMVEDNGSITLTLTPDAGSGLRYVKVDGKNVSLDGLVENRYTFSNVTKNHVIEVGFKLAIPATQKTVTWLHYQGEPASFYTVDNVYKFYDLPYLDKEVPREDYVQTLLDEEGKPIDDDEIILPGSYDVHVTHPGNADYAAMDVIYTDALVLGKCPGTPGRPVVYGKLGCTQGDLTTISALQDYYGSDGTLIDAAHDEIPVTLVWQNPETRYDTAGNFYASATIYAAEELDQRLLDCYNLDDEGTPLTGGCLISARNTQVVVLPADEASIIRLQASDDSGGTVSGKGVYKNGEQVTVTATVNENAGFRFNGWQENGEVVCEDATYTFEASGDRTLTALFEVNEDYRVILKTDPTDAGTVTGGGSYEEATDHSATVKATANQGYYFIGWYAGEEQKSTDAEYTFTVGQEGITLTAKFGVDLLARAELAKENLESALGTSVFEWSTLTQAVDAYEKAEEFMKELPVGVEDADERFEALTGYYSGIEELDLSGQGISSADLAKLYLFTGLTDLNLSDNKGVTSLEGLPNMANLETLNLSGTGVSDLSSLTGLTTLKNLNLSNNKGISDLTALKGLTTLKTLDISGTGVTAFDTLVNDSGKIALSSLTTLTAQNLTLTSISDLATFISEDSYLYMHVKSWDFTGSTLPPKDQNRTNVATIQEKLGNKFIPPTVPDNTYIISASPATLNFGSVYPNYTQPVAQTVTIENTGNQPVTLTLSTPEHYILGDISDAELEPNGTATFTVRPRPDLEVGTYNETLTVTGSSGSHTAPATVQLQFEVAQQPTGGGGGVATYAVTVEKAEHGKVTASPSRASSGTPVTITVTPDEGYELEKLTVTDSKGSEVKLTDKGNSKYTFDMPNSKVEIKVVFRKIAPVWENCPGGVDCPAYSYGDVDTSAWYHEAVDYVLVNGLMSGYGNGVFGPNDHLSRAQLCQILYNKEGRPAVTGSSAFTDVADGAWYADAVTWAAENGIVGGYGGGLFGPEDNITREQLAAILYRYAQTKGYDVSVGEDTNILSYADALDVSEWAIPAMQWACGSGVINGVTDSTLVPQGNATRAQAATMLMRFCSYCIDAK